MTYAADMFRAGLLGLQSTYLGYEVLILAVESTVMFLFAIKHFKSLRI
jgi:hypothetical protein